MTTTYNPCRGFWFPAEAIEQVVWPYDCFGFSLRNVALIPAARLAIDALSR
ncbi:MAG: hypothetical protein ACJ8AI_22705 [Rhodopila sp.]|jgi:transposase-like protein